MSVSIAGLIGAALGGYLGWIDWKILKGILEAIEGKNRRGGGDGGLVARYGALLRGLSFAFPLIGFPIIGYLAGSQLVG
ncbi:hypothetical protein [Roseibium algae]|uniref:Uncharacterized protein n=1 Tax=Roseibium algae TaxID=3123038 RepID=A0ABU8TJK0_9HYPH